MEQYLSEPRVLAEPCYPWALWLLSEACELSSCRPLVYTEFRPTGQNRTASYQNLELARDPHLICILHGQLPPRPKSGSQEMLHRNVDIRNLEP